MANISHKNLTGLQLHENKGVDTATAGQVATANGSGATVWKKLDSSNLAATGNPFGAGLLHVRNERSPGTSSGDSAVANFNTLVLNTVKTNEISGASLASNKINLPAGTYFLEARSTPYAPNLAGSAFGGGKCRIRNVTDGSTLIYGNQIYFQNGSASSIYPTPFVLNAMGRFTLAGTKDVEFQLYPQSCAPAGAFNSAGENEVYSEVLIWKVA